MVDAYAEFERSVWHRIFALRWLYRMLIGDKIWPFVINRWTMSVRAGFVIVRARKGVAAIITLVS